MAWRSRAGRRLRPADQVRRRGDGEPVEVQPGAVRDPQRVDDAVERGGTDADVLGGAERRPEHAPDRVAPAHDRAVEVLGAGVVVP